MIRVKVRCCGEVIGTLPVPEGRAYDGSEVAFWRESPWLARLPGPSRFWSRPSKIPDILHLTVMEFTEIIADKFGDVRFEVQPTFYADAPELVAKIRKLKSFQAAA